MTDSRAFLARLRSGDPATLGAVVDEHARRLYRAARGMGFLAEDAEDLVQDVFVTFVHGLDRFEGRSNVGTWLFGILYHKIQERRRSSAREEAHDPADEVFESRFDARGSWIRLPIAPDREATSREVGVALRKCLDDLPPLQRAVFELRQVEELSAAEAGNVLGQTVTYIGVLLHRARTRLRECLDRKGWTSTT